MANYGQHLNPNNTPQSQPLPGKKMIQNAAGGYVFELDDWQRLRRFLILGAEGGTFYAKERELTIENAQCLERCLKADGKRTVEMIVEISDGGLAPKNDAAVFALAYASQYKGEDNRAGGTGLETRKLALRAIKKVCRIGTHLFQFCQAREAVGAGWGRLMREAVSYWYRRPDLIMQALKFQQRNGMSHRDVLRLAHPKARDEKEKLIYDAICRPDRWGKVEGPLVDGYLKAQAASSAKEVAGLITQYSLPREFIPTQFLTDVLVWDALLPHMGMTALVRNLGNMGKAGLIKPLAHATTTVINKLTDKDAIKRSRIHPFSLLLAGKVYASGHSVLGDGKWVTVPAVIDALDKAFEYSFGNVKPTNKSLLLALDVSGSMSSLVQGSVMSNAEATAGMALITARTEPNYHIVGFAKEVKELGISARDTFMTVMRKTREHNFGGTDTSAAIRWAAANKIKADAFVIYTDNETWSGDGHTSTILNQYRKMVSAPTKLGVVAFSATASSIREQSDPYSADFVGLDASLPQMLTAFLEL